MNISGKNIIKFIKRLNSHHIEILNIKYTNNSSIIIKVYKKDLDKIYDLKTTYEITEQGYDGFIKIARKISINKFIIIFILCGFCVIVFLSRLIFSIDIITNDNKMKKKILDELNANGLKLYSFKKSFKDLQLIKSNILNKYRLEIDWLEIENIGTKYIVRYEPRINNDVIENNKFRHIVSLKNAVIYDMDVSSGQIVKNKNDYVKRGDIIVSGYIYLNDSIKGCVSSQGKIYGEVWYEVTVTYPLKYHENILTGKSKNVYVIKILNKNIELLNLKHYKDKKVKSNILLKSNILPFSLEKQYQEELKVKDENNTIEEAISKAVDVGSKKIEDNLGENEFILNKKILGSFNDKNSVTVKIFYSVVEDITDYQEIEEFKENNNEVIN